MDEDYVGIRIHLLSCKAYGLNTKTVGMNKLQGSYEHRHGHMGRSPSEKAFLWLVVKQSR
jgi:hypothetical protein